VPSTHPIAWELRSTVEGQSSQTLFASKAIAEREATYIRNANGHFVFTRISPVTIRQG
jgi:hypothetical protein